LITVYVARHGETTWNAERRIQGTSDPDLSPRGYDQSRELFEELKDRPLSAIYTSTRQRALHTAQPLADFLRLPIRARSELDEMNFGAWEGKTPADFGEDLRNQWQRYRENRLTFRIPGGESYLEVMARVRPFAEEIVREHPGQEILTVGHRGSNRMLMALLLDYPLEQAVTIEQANDCIYVLQRNGSPQVFRLLKGEKKEGLLFESDHFHHVVPPTPADTRR
jgi:broad specificity phosphatase PhoE